jgi:uncharacterized RDD family membrane protein YckC
MNSPVKTPKHRLRLRRFAATLLDLLILIPAALLIMLVTGLVESAEAWVMPQPIIRLSALVIGTYLLVNGYPLLTRGQTLGKRIMGIRLADVHSGQLLPAWRLGLRAGVVPAVALLVSLQLLLPLYVICALPIFGPAQRCLQDYLAQSVVVRAD